MLIILIPASVVAFYIWYLHDSFKKYGLFCALHRFARKSCERVQRFVDDAYAPRHHISLDPSFWLSVGQYIEHDYTASRVDHWEYRRKFKTDEFTIYIVFLIAHKNLCKYPYHFFASEMEALEFTSNFLLQHHVIDSSSIQSALDEVSGIYKDICPGVDYWTPTKNK